MRLGAIAAALIVAVACLSGIASAAGPVRVAASFEHDASLGAPTVVNAELYVDPRKASSPATVVEVMYPASLGVLSSGLGLASCTRPETDFVAVIISGPRLGGCSPNAVMAYGTAIANVRLSDGQVIREFATVTLLSGEIRSGTVGLVIFVDGQRPFGGKLIYVGEVRSAPRPFGGALVARLPAIPSLAGVATVSLVRLALAIGSREIVYRDRSGRYRPEGIVLPSRCPRDDFRFRARVTFENGTRASAATAVPCPPASGLATR